MFGGLVLGNFWGTPSRWYQRRFLQPIFNFSLRFVCRDLLVYAFVDGDALDYLM